MVESPAIRSQLGKRMEFPREHSMTEKDRGHVSRGLEEEEQHREAETQRPGSGAEREHREIDL